MLIEEIPTIGMRYRSIDEAIAIRSGVEQGFSSAIFTERPGEAERFLTAEGSDSGIAGVNLGTSGAETGREAGPDSTASIRRQTCGIDGGTGLPPARGVRFDVGMA